MRTVLTSHSRIDMVGCSEEDWMLIKEIVKKQGNRVSCKYGNYPLIAGRNCLRLDFEGDLVQSHTNSATYTWREFLMKNGKMKVKPETEVTITISYAELLRCVCVMGVVTGDISMEKTVYSQAKSILSEVNPNFEEIYFRSVVDMDKDRRRRYHLYQASLEKEVFNPETEEDKRIRELEETIAKAQQQIQELKSKRP